MDAQAAKMELLQWVQNLEDSTLLGSLLSVKKSYSKKDWWSELTPEQIKDIELGEKDIEQGKTMSSKEFWANYEK